MKDIYEGLFNKQVARGIACAQEAGLLTADLEKVRENAKVMADFIQRLEGVKDIEVDMAVLSTMIDIKQQGEA